MNALAPILPVDDDPYAAFLRGKLKQATASGFDVGAHEVHPQLMGHQAAIVRWAVKGGRRAIFAAFGLGKSMMQLEAVRLVLARLRDQGQGSARGLIVCPLGVRQEFVRDGRMLGLTVKFVRSLGEITVTITDPTGAQTVIQLPTTGTGVSGG